MAEKREVGRKSAVREVVPSLIIGAVGGIGTIVYFLIDGGFQFIEFVLVLMMVVLAATGYKERLLRGIMTLVILYVVLGLAMTFYRPLAPWLAAIIPGEAITNTKLAFSFIILLLLGWVAFEMVSRRLFDDTSIPRLGVLDNVGGVVVYLFVGLLVAALLFNAFGYGQPWRYAHDRAKLRETFRQVLQTCYSIQTFWFDSRPALYVYDLGP